MRMFELLPRPLGSTFRKLTHLTCNSRRNNNSESYNSQNSNMWHRGISFALYSSPHQMVGSEQAVRGIAIWYNTAMLFLLAAAILMLSTTGTCLAQTGLPAAEAEAYYATNDIRIVTSADLARN